MLKYSCLVRGGGFTFFPYNSEIHEKKVLKNIELQTEKAAYDFYLKLPARPFNV